MKRNILFLSITLVLAAFLFSIPIIDNFSAYRVSSIVHAYDDMGYERVGLTIENTDNLSSVNPEEFYATIDKYAKENHLVITISDQSLTDKSLPEFTVYVTSNEINYSKQLLLESGYADKIASYEIYSTNSNNKENKIISFMPNVSLTVRPITQLERKGKYMNMISLDGDIKENAKSFFNSLADKYGEISVSSLYTSSKNSVAEEDKVALNGIFNQKQLKFATCLVLIVLLCTKVFSCSRKISILKVEGVSPIKIYYSLFLRYFLRDILLSFALFTLIIFIIFGSNKITFFTLLFIFTIEFLQLIAISLLISLIILIIIHYTPAISSIKGMNKLDEVQVFAYFIKFICIFLILPLLSSTLQGVQNLVVMTIRHDHVYEMLENRYVFGTQGVSTAYEKDIGTKKYIQLRDELAKGGKLFEQAKAFFFPDDFLSFDPNYKDEYYAVDAQYLKKENLLSGCNLEHICVFIKENSKVNKEDLIQKINNSISEKLPIHFITYNQELESYNFTDYLYRDSILNYPLIYIPKEPGFDGQLNGNILLFDGTIDEAQKYVDDLFISYGYSPYFKIESQQTAYQNMYWTYKTTYTKQLIQFIVILLAYIYSNRLLVEVDMDNNRKRYWLAKVEGTSPYSFFVYFFKIGTPALLAIIGNLILKRLFFNSSLILVILFVFICECLLYFMFKYKYANIRRLK